MLVRQRRISPPRDEQLNDADCRGSGRPHRGTAGLSETATFSGVWLPANENGFLADIPASRNARTRSRSVSPIAL